MHIKVNMVITFDEFMNCFFEKAIHKFLSICLFQLMPGTAGLILMGLSLTEI